MQRVVMRCTRQPLHRPAATSLDTLVEEKSGRQTREPVFRVTEVVTALCPVPIW
jgi:hypothetical protein